MSGTDNAFPLFIPAKHEHGFHTEESIIGGLTKRELFAAMTMQGIGLGASGMGHEHIAGIAVALADALLTELAK